MNGKEGAKRFGQVRHLSKVGNPWSIEPGHNLSSPKRGLSQGLGERFQSLAIEILAIYQGRVHLKSPQMLGNKTRVIGKCQFKDLQEMLLVSLQTAA